jgi:O-antigen ligase
MGFLFLGALYLHRRSSAMTAWKWYPVMALALLMVLLSGSRGALMATSIGGCTYLLIDNRYRTRNVLAVSCFLILTQVAMLSTEMGEQAFQMFETRILRQTLERQYMSGRDELFAAAYELGLERPWFGQGLSGFTIVLGYNYPHNIALELFCETGVVGVSLLVILLVAVLNFVARHRHSCDPATWGAFGLALSSAMFSGDFFDSRGVLLLAILGSQEIAAFRASKSLTRSQSAGVARLRAPSYKGALPSHI